MELTHGSLFTGIGVFDLACKNHGITNIFGCDNNPFSKVHYATHNPGASWFDDITTMQEMPYSDILTFGFPCQDASIAAPIKHQNPLNEARTGLFWDAMRLIRTTRPKFIIAENVARLRNKGLEECLRAFATSGYHAGYAVIPACRFGALHERERLFIICADSRCIGREKVLQILTHTLTEKTGKRLGNESFRDVCQKMELETQYFDNGRDYGTAYWLHAGLRAKAIGNSIYYPIAEALIKAVKVAFTEGGSVQSFSQMPTTHISDNQQMQDAVMPYQFCSV